MRIKVTNRFKDADTGQPHDPGEVLKVSEERAKSIVAVGCGEVLLELDEPEVLELDEPEVLELDESKPAKRKRKRGRPRKTKALEPEENK